MFGSLRWVFVWIRGEAVGKSRKCSKLSREGKFYCKPLETLVCYKAAIWSCQGGLPPRIQRSRNHPREFVNHHLICTTWNTRPVRNLAGARGWHRCPNTDAPYRQEARSIGKWWRSTQKLAVEGISALGLRGRWRRTLRRPWELDHGGEARRGLPWGRTQLLTERASEQEGADRRGCPALALPPSSLLLWELPLAGRKADHSAQQESPGGRPQGSTSSWAEGTDGG